MLFSRQMRSLARSCALSTLLCLSLAALCHAQAAEEPAQPARPSVKGVLTGNDVNVRSGPGTEYPVYYTAQMGASVDVVGRDGLWLKIELPEKDYSWVAAEYIQPTSKNTAIVTGSNVNVRSGPGVQFDINYSVQAGHAFNILGNDISGKWFKIAPLPDTVAYVTAEFVRLSGPLPGEGPVAPQPTPATTAVAPAPTAAPTAPVATPSVAPAPPADLYDRKLAEAVKAFDLEVANENPAEWDLVPLAEAFADIESNSTNPVQRVQARARLAQLHAYTSVKARAIARGEVDDELKERLLALETERRQALAVSTADLPYIATGELQKFYITGLGDATHKLTVDSSITYLLRSRVLDLSNYEGKACGIKGKVVSLPGLKVQVIEVTSAAILPGQGS